jgi:hypothetical protein
VHAGQEGGQDVLTAHSGNNARGCVHANLQDKQK